MNFCLESVWTHGSVGGSVHAPGTLLDTVDLILHCVKFINGNLICSIVGHCSTWERLGVCKERALRLQKHMGRL